LNKNYYKRLLEYTFSSWW